MSNSSLMADISALHNQATSTTIRSSNTAAGSSQLEMTDFLKLMVQQFQNQDIDNAASTTDMMNQLVQMSVMQAVTNVTQATTMLYSASLVGKEVTIGQYDERGKLTEIVGTVEGTGTYNSSPVVFVDGKSYYMSEIMAVGRLPQTEQTTGDSNKSE